MQGNVRNAMGCHKLISGSFRCLHLIFIIQILWPQCLMLFFPVLIANFDDFRKVYSRSTLFTLSWYASLKCFCLICIIQALTVITVQPTVQLITVTQKPCFHLSVSTRMILCRLLHVLCYSLRSLKLGTKPWYSTGPYPNLFTGQ